uniref:Uncharacterized protein n=1 Tax=Bionectria ochroleuca TaxID=29856 RepID=A0A0B7KHX5_BIOOC
MQLDYFHMPWYYSTIAGLLSWMLLAGYLITPSTYASLTDSEALNKAGSIGKSLMTAVRNLPLLVLASALCIIATLGLIILWFRLRFNYIWIQRHVVTPVLLNSAMGFFSAMLNIYTDQGGQWSITAIVTGSVIGSWLLCSAVLYILYYWLLYQLEIAGGNEIEEVVGGERKESVEVSRKPKEEEEEEKDIHDLDLPPLNHEDSKAHMTDALSRDLPPTYPENLPGVLTQQLTASPER